MTTATYNAQNANSIEAAYERDAESIYALSHSFRGFCRGVTAASAVDPYILIDDQREHTVMRQEAIQAHMSDLYFDLLDIDPARAHKLPEIPFTVAEIEARRANERTP